MALPCSQRQSLPTEAPPTLHVTHRNTSRTSLCPVMQSVHVNVSMRMSTFTNMEDILRTVSDGARNTEKLSEIICQGYRCPPAPQTSTRCCTGSLEVNINKMLHVFCSYLPYYVLHGSDKRTRVGLCFVYVAEPCDQVLQLHGSCARQLWTVSSHDYGSWLVMSS